MTSTIALQVGPESETAAYLSPPFQLLYLRLVISDDATINILVLRLFFDLHAPLGSLAVLPALLGALRAHLGLAQVVFLDGWDLDELPMHESEVPERRGAVQLHRGASHRSNQGADGDELG